MLYTKMVLMAVFWSGVFPAISIVLQSMGVFTSVFLRFAAGALILLALLYATEGRLRRLSRCGRGTRTPGAPGSRPSRTRWIARRTNS